MVTTLSHHCGGKEVLLGTKAPERSLVRAREEEEGNSSEQHLREEGHHVVEVRGGL